MKIPSTALFAFGTFAAVLPGTLKADLVFSDDFSANQREFYERVDIWQSSGESAWNIVDGEMRMLVPEGTTAFMYSGATLSNIGDYAQIDFRFSANEANFGLSAGLYLNDAFAGGGLEIRMTLQDQPVGDSLTRFQLGGEENDTQAFATNSEVDWSTLRVEIVSVEDTTAIYEFSMEGRYSLAGSFQRDVGQYVGFMQYNGMGEISQDNFTVSAIPEPGTTAVLMGAGALGAVILMSRRRAKRAASVG